MVAASEAVAAEAAAADVAVAVIIINGTLLFFPTAPLVVYRYTYVVDVAAPAVETAVSISCRQIEK